MKKIIRFFALLVTLTIAFAIFPRQTFAQQNDVSYQEFYDQLSPYGQWIENPDYGYIWIPTVSSDFAPYSTNGYWILTDYGWMWESNYDWGWAPFHYGRWDYSDYYGWFWVPDNQWGPSWVTWRRSNGYYGWTPMRPGISINISFGSYNDVPNDRWVFVRDRDFERHDIDRNYIDRTRNPSIINNSTVISKTYYDNKRHSTYIAGPSRDDVQKNIGRTLNPVTVHERNKPGQSFNNNQVQIYMPQVIKNNSVHKPAPSKITTLQNVKRVPVTDTKNQARNLQLQNNKPVIRKQQPDVNIPNKINRKENLPPQRNINPPDNSINKKQQTHVNTVNKIETKNNVPKTPWLDPPKKVNNNNRTPQPRNTNPPNDNIIKNHPYQKPNLVPPMKDNRKVQPMQPKNKIVPKNNNNSDKSPKARTLTPPKKDSKDKPPISNPNNNNKENGNSK